MNRIFLLGFIAVLPFFVNAQVKFGLGGDYRLANNNFGTGFGLQACYVLDTKSPLSLEIDAIVRKNVKTDFSLNGNLLFHFTKPENILRPYLIGGLNYSEPDATNNYTNFIGYNLGLGATINLSGMFLLIEYKKTLNFDFNSISAGFLFQISK